MLEKIARFADSHNMLPGPGDTVLAAVSGGADSVCLLRVLLSLSQRRGFQVACAHFNHRLRGEESDRDEAFVRDLCRTLGVPFHAGGADVKAEAARRKRGIEETARRLRYAFLQETAQTCGAAVIATAHTADDNTETVLMNLARGAGPRGLSGIPPVRGNVIRPMLCVTRREVLSFLESCGQDFVEDSSNAQDAYTRNRLRHTVIPLLQEMNPRLHEAVLSAARLLRQDDEYLTVAALRFLEEQAKDGAVPCDQLLSLPPPLSSRAVRLLSDAALTAEQTEAVLELCRAKDGTRTLSLPGLEAVVEYGALRFERPTPPASFAPVRLSPGERAEIPELSMAVTLRKKVCPDDRAVHKNFNSFLFNCDKVYGMIVIRPRQTGDKITLAGRNGTRTLKRLFIDEKIPLRRRGLIPVVADEAGVLAVYGVGQDVRALPESARPALEIIFEEI